MHSAGRPGLAPAGPLSESWRSMSKEDNIEVTGTVLEKFPSGLFSVQLEHQRVVLAHLAGGSAAIASAFWRATRSPWNSPLTISPKAESPSVIDKYLRMSLISPFITGWRDNSLPIQRARA